jgi:SAM-dependent methyltransferase
MPMADQTSHTAVQVRELFDAKATAWSSKYAPDGRLAERLTRLRAAVSDQVAAGSSVLDLGCGTGELAVGLAATGLRATGCDISPEMLRRAAASDSSGTVNWVQLDPGWQVLPFRPEVYDAVVASSVLEYVDDPVTVLRECRRVLRPGGVMLCTVPDPVHPVRWLEWAGAVTAWASPVRALGLHSPRLNAYLTYLTISRQRHSARWWRNAAARTGLLTEAALAHRAARAPLRLLVLRRPET